MKPKPISRADIDESIDLLRADLKAISERLSQMPAYGLAPELLCDIVPDVVAAVDRLAHIVKASR